MQKLTRTFDDHICGAISGVACGVFMTRGIYDITHDLSVLIAGLPKDKFNLAAGVIAATAGLVSGRFAYRATSFGCAYLDAQDAQDAAQKNTGEDPSAPSQG